MQRFSLSPSPSSHSPCLSAACPSSLPLSPRPSPHDVHDPLALVHRVSRAREGAACVTLPRLLRSCPPAPLSATDALVESETFRAILGAARGRSDLGFRAARLLRKVSAFPRAARNSCPFGIPGDSTDAFFRCTRCEGGCSRRRNAREFSSRRTSIRFSSRVEREISPISRDNHRAE